VVDGLNGLDKERVRDALAARLAEQHGALAESQRGAQAGATHEEARPEHAKDTRAAEASYLARGLARRVAELRDAMTAVASLELTAFGPGDPVALAALVALEDEAGAPRLVFLAPAGGGEMLAIEGVRVQVLTPASPLGRSLIGRTLGDEIRVELPGGAQELELVDLA